MVLTCGNRKPTQPPPLETQSYSCRSALRPWRVFEQEKPGGVQPDGVLLAGGPLGGAGGRLGGTLAVAAIGVAVGRTRGGRRRGGRGGGAVLGRAALGGSGGAPRGRRLGGRGVRRRLPDPDAVGGAGALGPTGGGAVAVGAVGLAAGGHHEPARRLAGLADLAALGEGLQGVADGPAGSVERLGDLVGRQLLAGPVGQVGEHLVAQPAGHEARGPALGIDGRGGRGVGWGAAALARRGGLGGLAVARAGSLAVALRVGVGIGGGGAGVAGPGPGAARGLAAVGGGQDRQGGPGRGRGPPGGRQERGHHGEQPQDHPGAVRVVGEDRHVCPLSWGAAVLRATWYLRRRGAVKLVDLRFCRISRRFGPPRAAVADRIGGARAWYAHARGAGVGAWGRPGGVGLHG